ncbi:MAG: heavy metal sensor histidine kinase [Acidobacteriota bacterium]
MRLTLWYVSLLGGLLVLYCAGTTVLLFRALHRQIGAHTIEDLETIEGLLFFDPEGRLQLREDYHNHPESRRVQERLLEIRAPDGSLLFRNERLNNRSLDGLPFPGEGEGTYSQRSTRLADGTRVQLASRRHVIDGHPLIIRLAYSEDLIWQAFEELLTAQVLGLLLSLGLAGIAGYFLARRALAPLDEMARTAERITSERLHERLPAESVDDELGHLARVFNHTLARLEQSFEQLRRFTSDASHELRTPLTAIRSVGEVGLQKNGTPREYREIIGSMLEEANRLTNLVDRLLTMSRVDAGQIALQRSEIQVLSLARESALLFEVLMEEKGLRLILEGDGFASVEGDRVLLRQAIVNILDNAIKYSPPGGTISVGVADTEREGVVVEIRDAGPGIPTAHHARIFDRFYRVDEGRSRAAGGAGLGLSIAKWTVEAHGGDLRLESQPGNGCAFLIQLPSLRCVAGEIPADRPEPRDDAGLGEYGSSPAPGRRKCRPWRAPENSGRARARPESERRPQTH